MIGSWDLKLSGAPPLLSFGVSTQHLYGGTVGKAKY